MFCDASMYGKAMSELEGEFSDPTRVIHATMHKLFTTRMVRDGEMPAAVALSRDL